MPKQILIVHDPVTNALDETTDLWLAFFSDENGEITLDSEEGTGSTPQSALDDLFLKMVMAK